MPLQMVDAYERLTGSVGKALAKATPTTRAPTRPGPCVTPTAASSLGAMAPSTQDQAMLRHPRAPHPRHQQSPQRVCARLSWAPRRQSGMKKSICVDTWLASMAIRIDNRHGRLGSRRNFFDSEHARRRRSISARSLGAPRRWAAAIRVARRRRPGEALSTGSTRGSGAVMTMASLPTP